jgi:hypothetical protein
VSALKTIRPWTGDVLWSEKSCIYKKLLGLLLCLAMAPYCNSANSDPTQKSNAEAALAGKVKCEDFRKNSDGTWTSGPNAKIGSNPFPNLTFDAQRVTIGGADLATVLDRKCGH